MRVFQKCISIRMLIAYVALWALLFWAMRISRDSRPARLYASWLDHDDVSRRVQAAQELGDAGSEADIAVAALVRSLLDDRAASVRKQSALSLAKVVSARNDILTTTAAAKAFVQALKDQDSGARTAAADGLGRIGALPEVAIPALLQSTGDQSEWVRGAAVAALGLIEKKAGIDQPEVRSAIVAAINDSSLHVRELGIYAFLAVAENSPEFSASLLRAGDSTTRQSPVTALARSSLAASAVIPELTTALTDKDAAVRDGAARARANMGLPTLAPLPSNSIPPTR